MERRIGEQFNYDEVTLEVCVAKAPIRRPCEGCYFLHYDRCYRVMDITGKCSKNYRTDKREVYFKEVKP